MFRIGKSIKTENGLEFTRAWEKKEREVTTNGYVISFWGDENV